ncbi:MAG: photosystem II reaction center protein PsbN [Phormidesmis sp.]
MANLDSATVLIVSVASIVGAFTLYAVYTAFGPPSKQLSDPFEDHED